MHACMIERFYLFYSFFVYLTTVLIAHYITVNDDGMIREYWIGIDVGEVVMAWFEVGLLSWHLPGETDNSEKVR